MSPKRNEDGAVILHVWDWMKASQCPECEGIIDANNRIGAHTNRVDEIDVSATQEEYERKRMCREMRDQNACPHCRTPIALIVHLTPENGVC